MKNYFKRVIIIALALATALSLAPGAAYAVEADPVIRIGLYYGSSALPSANLENYTGSGYYFGWFDNKYEFITVGQTSQTTITTMKDKNIYLSSGLYYDTPTAGSYSTIGAYHLQYSAVYGSFDEASAAAATFTSAAAFPAYINGIYCVRIGSYTTADNAVAAASSLGLSGNVTVVGGSTTCYTVTITKTATILFEFDYGTYTAFGIMPDTTGVSNNQTWFKGNRYCGGFEYKRISGNDITVINYVGMQNYVKGILPYEMSPSWPIEALKAQALCAKSYALCNMGKHSASGFDLCNTTDCQVYQGMSSASDRSNQATDETYGQFVMYNGSVAMTYYHSSDGGATEDAKNVWGTDYPYLKGVIDPYESVNYTWSHTFTPADLTWLLSAKGYSLSGNVADCYVSKLTNVGNVYTVTFVNDSGKALAVSMESARTLFYTETLGNKSTSQRYSIIPNGTSGSGSPVYVNGGSATVSAFSGKYAIGGSGSTGTIGSNSVSAITGSGTETVTASGSVSPAASFTVKGTGLGHNVGMSQWGAYAMANQGFTYEQIIKFYFTGVTIGR